jgi:hypothetical protein
LEVGIWPLAPRRLEVDLKLLKEHPTLHCRSDLIDTKCAGLPCQFCKDGSDGDGSRRRTFSDLFFFFFFAIVQPLALMAAYSLLIIHHKFLIL